MSRRRRVIHKEVKVDSRYASPAVARLIDTVMRSGQKSLAERIVYEAIERSREGSDAVDPLDSLHKALDNAKPRLEVKSRRVGGATYQVPIEVSADRQISLAMRWLVNYAKNRRGTIHSYAGNFDLERRAHSGRFGHHRKNRGQRRGRASID